MPAPIPVTKDEIDARALALGFGSIRPTDHLRATIWYNLLIERQLAMTADINDAVKFNELTLANAATSMAEGLNKTP